MFAIETLQLTKRYGAFPAVDGLDLQVSIGSIYGFIGPNGAGKTTTLRMLAGLIEPSRGAIRLMDQPLTPDKAAWQVGYMPDFFGVYDDLRCWEYLDFFARCYSLPAAERQAKVGQLLDLVDLTPKRNAFVQHLSRGQQQRLCLAHALMHDPPILLLDEPASGLDPRARVEFRELLRALREMGKTILLSSHILSELAEVCDEIGILDKGRLVAGGTTPSVRRQLHAGKSLRVRVLSDQEQALRILQGCPGVTAARLAEEGDLPPAYADDMDVQATAAQTLIVSFDGDEAARANLLAALIQQGIAVSNFHLHEDSLETLFLRLTADG